MINGGHGAAQDKAAAKEAAARCNGVFRAIEARHNGVSGTAAVQRSARGGRR